MYLLLSYFYYLTKHVNQDHDDNEAYTDENLNNR